MLVDVAKSYLHTTQRLIKARLNPIAQPVGRVHALANHHKAGEQRQKPKDKDAPQCPQPSRSPA